MYVFHIASQNIIKFTQKYWEEEKDYLRSTHLHCVKYLNIKCKSNGVDNR